MLRSHLHSANIFVRYASQEGKKRFMQTVPAASKRSPVASFGRLNYELNTDFSDATNSRSLAKHTLPRDTSRWARHTLETPAEPAKPEEPINVALPARRARTARFRSAGGKKLEEKATPPVEAPAVETASMPEKAAAASPAQTETAQTETQIETKKKPRRQLRPRKALITLTPTAIEHLRALLEQPEPQLIRIGVQNRGCSGLTYNLEYVSKPGKFDEFVEQDGVKVLIDSKALFSIVGSEMDWLDDKLSSRFIFKNPNSKGTCGCGESFMV